MRKRNNWVVPKGVEYTEMDKKILSFQDKGFLVPSRNLIRTPEEIEGIRRSGIVNTGVLDLVAQEIHAGMTTLEIDKLVYDYTIAHGATPATLGYEGFPKSCCTSINEVVCHGIPNEFEVLQEGDIITLDIGACYKGYHGDSAWTYPVGKISKKCEDLLEWTRESLFEGLSVIKDGAHVGGASSPLLFCLRLSSRRPSRRCRRRYPSRTRRTVRR